MKDDVDRKVEKMARQMKEKTGEENNRLTPKEDVQSVGDLLSEHNKEKITAEEILRDVEEVNKKQKSEEKEGTPSLQKLAESRSKEE